jgi:class 3 adenylate cyclase
MSALPSGIVTFLFTDIEGSTGLLQRLGDRYAALLAEAYEALRDVLRLAHADVVKRHIHPALHASLGIERRLSVSNEV